jgi:hypothetical protein
MQELQKKDDLLAEHKRAKEDAVYKVSKKALLFVGAVLISVGLSGRDGGRQSVEGVLRVDSKDERESGCRMETITSSDFLIGC